MNNFRILLLVGLIPMALLLSGCGRDDNDGPAERATAVTATWPQWQAVERTETSVGRLEALARPVVAAETAGRVVAIHRDVGDEVVEGELLAELDAESQGIAVTSAKAEIRRLQAMLDNQSKQFARLQNLAQRQSVARDQLDEAETQVEVISAQLEAAGARLADAEFNLARTRIKSPVTGHIQRRLISSGDFVSVGRLLFEVLAQDALQALLPLPERLQDQVQAGQVVRLSIPAQPDEIFEAPITDLRPMIGGGARSLEVIVALDNPGTWRAGGTVTGRVVLESRESLVVPPGSVVRRPAGEVVYVIDGDNRARQQPVRTGLRHAQWVEIVEGLSDEESIVFDGAGFLTDGALLDIQDWVENEAHEAGS
jgi:RND family efflux transporter MFP subunit